MGDDNEEREREEQSRGFTVVDRRGTEREEEPGAEAPPSGAEGAEGSARTSPPGESAHAGSPPPIDFATFVLSLGTSALYHLGLVEDPQTGEKNPRPNVPLARQTIDTIEMLRDKTRGNLSEEESRLLDSLLYELRMQFVESSQ